jgi:hypothetical protein
MVIIDFFIYYMTYWYENSGYKLVWHTPISMACYVIGLASTCLLYSINDIIHFTILKNVHYKISLILFVILALGIIQLYDFIYVQKDRYKIITPSNFGLLKNISDRNRSVIALIIFFVITLSPFFVFMFFIPFGGHTLKNYE